jgi:hypothetical protein
VAKVPYMGSTCDALLNAARRRRLPQSVGSAFDRPAASVRDRDADDLDRLAVSLDWLAYYCCSEPFVDEASKHLGLEPMADHELIPGGTVRIASEQF